MNPIHSQCNGVPSKRSRIVWMEVFIVENGFTTYNESQSLTIDWVGGPYIPLKYAIK